MSEHDKMREVKLNIVKALIDLYDEKSASVHDTIKKIMEQTSSLKVSVDDMGIKSAAQDEIDRLSVIMTNYVSNRSVLTRLVSSLCSKKHTKVGLLSMVKVRLEAKIYEILILDCCAGEEVDNTTIVSLQSPMVASILGKEEGDDFLLNCKSGKKVGEILEIN